MISKLAGVPEGVSDGFKTKKVSLWRLDVI